MATRRQQMQVNRRQLISRIKLTTIVRAVQKSINTRKSINSLVTVITRLKESLYHSTRGPVGTSSSVTWKSHHLEPLQNKFFWRERRSLSAISKIYSNSSQNIDSMTKMKQQIPDQRYRNTKMANTDILLLEIFKQIIQIILEFMPALVKQKIQVLQSRILDNLSSWHCRLPYSVWI